MKPIIPIFLAVVFLPSAVLAREKPGFDYTVSAKMSFDNREYDATTLDESATLFGIRLKAAAGIKMRTGKSGTTHRILAGIDPLYDFGGSWTFQPLLYYKMTAPLAHSRLGIVAGIFPKSESAASYSRAFLSEYQQYIDDTREGIQFSWRSACFNYELGLDWRGQVSPKKPDRREEFVIYSGGTHRLGSIFRLGYAARMHHYACNYKNSATNVVDDILLNPYFEADFGYFTGLQTFKARLGYLQAFQRDRDDSAGMRSPGKGEFCLEARKWNVGVVNELYFGADLMPLFDCPAPEGGRYGSSLYLGDPMFRNLPGRDFAVYDRLSAYWQPNIARGLDFRIQVNLHFNGAFAGHQELISLIYSL